MLIKAYAEHEGYTTYNDKIIKAVKEIILRRIINITKIAGMIKDVVR